MNFKPVLDMSWGPALALLGIIALPFIATWTIASEAVALYLLEYHKSFWKCVGHSIVVNLISGAVGIFLQMFIEMFLFNMVAYFHWVNSLIGSPPIDDYQTLDPRTQTLGIAILLLVNWIGSILLEGRALMTLRKKQWDESFAKAPDSENHIRYAFEISAIINTVSYGGMLILLLL